MVAPCLEPYPPHSTSLPAKVNAGAVALGGDGNRLSQDHALSLALILLYTFSNKNEIDMISHQILRSNSRSQTS